MIWPLDQTLRQIDRSASDPVDASDRLCAWIAKQCVKTLDVVGNRASQAPGIVPFVKAILEEGARDLADQPRE